MCFMNAYQEFIPPHFFFILFIGERIFYFKKSEMYSVLLDEKKNVYP